MHNNSRVAGSWTQVENFVTMRVLLPVMQHARELNHLARIISSQKIFVVCGESANQFKVKIVDHVAVGHELSAELLTRVINFVL